MQGGPGLIPGQGTRSHMWQLRVYKLQLKILYVENKEIIVIKSILWPLAYECKLLSISLENKNDCQVSNFIVSTKGFFISSSRDTTSGNAAVIGFTV